MKHKVIYYYASPHTAYWADDSIIFDSYKQAKSYLVTRQFFYKKSLMYRSQYEDWEEYKSSENVEEFFFKDAYIIVTKINSARYEIVSCK